METSRINRERNHGLDFLKGIAVCLIVFVHMPFPKPFGVYLAYVGSVGVSLFFMTSGYFSLGASKGRLLHAIKRTCLYILVADILSLLWLMIHGGYDIGRLAAFLKSDVFTLEHFLKIFITSQSRVCHIAWFLFSLLFCYVYKLLLGKWLRLLGLIGLLAGIVVVLPPIGNYMEFPIYNHWLWGFPCFVMGELIHEHESWIRQHFNIPALVLLCLLGVSINLLARHNGTLWWHIGNMILAPASFVLFSGFNMKFNRFCLLGGTYPFFIYIVHPLVISYYMSVRQNPSTVELWLRPFIVLAATVLLATVYYQSKSWLGTLFKHRNG